MKKKQIRKILECKECGKEKAIVAKGLCGACYKRIAKPRAECIRCGKKAINDGGGLCPACWMSEKRSTKEGFISKIYQSMRKRHKEKGWKEIISRNEFIDFAENSLEFDSLWEVWIRSNKVKKLVPSIDRIDNDRGYTRDNIQFLTLSDNDKKKMDDYSDTGHRIKLIQNGKEYYFRSLKEGSRFVGKHDLYLSRYMLGQVKNPTVEYDVKRISHEEYLTGKKKEFETRYLIPKRGLKR